MTKIQWIAGTLLSHNEAIINFGILDNAMARNIAKKMNLNCCYYRPDKQYIFSKEHNYQNCNPDMWLSIFKVKILSKCLEEE